MAGRRALQRRPRAREPVRRRADGLDLRQPRRSERQPRPARRGARHPRDVRAHGDERRGDGRAHRRRSHVRQVPRRAQRRLRRARAGRLSGRDPGSRLAQPQRYRTRRRHGHQRHRGRVDQQPDAVGQRLPRQRLRLRVGTDREPRGREAVEADGPGRDRQGAGRARRVEAARADDADDRPRAAFGPGLRADLAALPRTSRRARDRVREGVVQADAPRHGPDLALRRRAGSRPSRNCGRTRFRRSTTTWSATRRSPS